MKITIMAGLAAKWNMNINARHKKNIREAKLLQYYWLFFLLSVISPALTLSQQNIRVKYIVTDSSSYNPNGLHNSFVSKIAINEYLSSLLTLFQYEGYISASFDSVSWQKDPAEVFLFMGEKYRWGSVKLPVNLSRYFNSVSGEPDKLIKSISAELENTGYVFSKISLDSIRLQNKILTGKLVIDSGRIYHLAHIITHGNIKLPAGLLYQSLQIHPSDVFNQKKIKNADEQVSKLKLFKVYQPAQIKMLPTGADLHLYLQRIKTNQLNCILGLSNDPQEKKLLFTGEADLLLNNSLSLAETISLHWSQLQPRSPQFNFLYNQPELFKRPGFSLNLNISKKDTSFYNFQFTPGIIFSLKNGGQLKLNYEHFVSRLLAPDTSYIKSRHALGNIADINIDALSAEYQSFQSYKEMRGSDLVISLYAGNKSLVKNSDILKLKDPAFDFNQLYDSVNSKKLLVKISAGYIHYITLKSSQVLKTSFEGAFFKTNNFFLNEMYQLGGAKKMRGFDDESIYADAYSMVSAEYRFLAANTSYFYFFLEGAMTHNKLNQLRPIQFFLGTGAGLNINISTGHLNIAYALGATNGQPLNFNQSKIHVTYSALF